MRWMGWGSEQEALSSSLCPHKWKGDELTFDRGWDPEQEASLDLSVVWLSSCLHSLRTSDSLRNWSGHPSLLPPSPYTRGGIVLTGKSNPMAKLLFPLYSP